MYYLRKPNDGFKSIPFDERSFKDLKDLDSVIICSNLTESDFKEVYETFEVNKLEDTLFWEHQLHALNYYSIKSSQYDSIDLFSLNNQIQNQNNNFICRDFHSLKHTRSFYRPLDINFISIQLSQLDQVLNFKEYLEIFPLK